MGKKKDQAKADKKLDRAFVLGIVLALLEVQRTHDAAMEQVRKAGIILPEAAFVDVVDIAMDILGVPADNTLEMIDKYGDMWHESEELYCREWVSDLWIDTVMKGKPISSFLAQVQMEASRGKVDS